LSLTLGRALEGTAPGGDLEVARIPLRAKEGWPGRAAVRLEEATAAYAGRPLAVDGLPAEVTTWARRYYLPRVQR
jgi:hypothetical protein